METKIRCTRCGKEKPASDYARKNGNGKILVKSCKACIEQKSARRYAHFVPKLAVSNEPLKDREVAEISAPYFAFIEALKAGTATEGMFYAACAMHYLYFALLKVFQADTFNADEDTEAAFRIGLALQVEDASGEVAETIDTIGKRYTERGKFIATGDELRLLQQTADRFKAALEMAAWKHYVRAIKESEPILDAEAHRKRKKQAA